MIAQKHKKNSIVKAILIFSAILFLIVILALSYIASAEASLANKIYPNVYLDNNPIGLKTIPQAYEPYKKIDNNLKKTKITVLYKEVPIATFSGTTLNLHSDAPEVLDRAYLIGRTSKPASRTYQKLAAIFGLNRFNFNTTVKYDMSKVDEFLTNTEDRYNKPAKDALFKFENGRVVNFRQEEKGLAINSKKFKEDIESAVTGLKEKNGNKLLNLEDKIIEPEVTLAESNEFGIEELIAEGSSNFAGSIPGRVHNVTLSSSKFNGVLIPKDKTISFNEIVGDISALTGYQQAYIIKNGRTVLGDGGGVCQTSTTLFRAALNAGLPIVERVPHAYRVSYYENDSKPGLDATVFSPSVDLKIKNNTPGSILIQTEIVGSILTFRIYGKKDGRKVEISPVKVWDIVPAPEPKNEDDPTLKKGVVKQVDFAAPGAKASFTYKVSGAPEVAFEKTFYSSYRPWQAVFLVGQAD